MALKDIPGITTMPKTQRDWIKFILDLQEQIGTGTAGGTDQQASVLPPTQEVVQVFESVSNDDDELLHWFFE